MFGRSERGSITAKIVPGHHAARRPSQRRRLALGSEVQDMTRVLVVEDDTQTANEIRAALGDHGFDVERAATGREGLLKAAAEPYDAIVLDRMLPGGLDGLGVFAALRAAGQQAPVLILSALSAVD